MVCAASRLSSANRTVVRCAVGTCGAGSVGGRGSEREDSIDDMVGPRLIGGVELTRFGRGLERPDDHSRRIGTQIQTLSIGKSQAHLTSGPTSRALHGGNDEAAKQNEGRQETGSG